ncbi:hypothetical protein GCK32_013009, partial [Trichostrongylus colubriformis]
GGNLPGFFVEHRCEGIERWHCCCFLWSFKK